MAAWRTSTSPCWTCRATRHQPIPRPTCAPRSPGTSALTPVRRSGFARRKTLDFDPLTEVQTFADLRRFPNLVDELRNVPVEDLIPRGYGSPAPIPRIFESGGTTGAPKRTAQLPDWIEQVTRWQVEDFTAGGFVPGRGLPCLMPSGPHGVGSLRPGGRRTAGVGVPPDRPGSPVGQEARRPKRGGGDGRLCRPRAGAGEVHPGDARTS